MRLIQKIRTKLIVALGGVTKEEHERLRDKYEIADAALNHAMGYWDTEEVE